MKRIFNILLIVSLLALVGSSGFTQKSSNGLTCQRQVNICQKRLGNLQDVLARVELHCANSGSEGCKNAVSILEEMLSKATIDCNNKIVEACT